MTIFKPLMTAIAVLGLAAAPAAAQDEADSDQPEMTKGEKKLAKLIEGRIAGEPESCIRDFPVRSFQVIDKTAIVYKIGRTVWVNYTKNPQSLDDHETLVFRRFGSQICSSDIVSTIDRFGGYYTGNVFLDKFIPYRLPESDG
ncbi:hypothetical protein [Parerythrobacter aestuarii]|uniref:hypothetical protein n=1 Tax=Parerythrobacter aestuarii TaxID=3020909 RepID=UPI0024DE6863|nr:hypothetical protein [Parerythrobacter aestuarii]